MPVYLVGTVNSTGRYKIGYSNEPEKRLKQMQTGSPYLLELVSVIDGDEDVERQLHKLYAPYKIRLEWFHLTPDHVSFLKTATKEDVLRVEIAIFLLGRDLSVVMKPSKVDEIRQEMMEVLHGYGIKDWRQTKRNTKQDNCGCQGSDCLICRRKRRSSNRVA